MGWITFASHNEQGKHVTAAWLNECFVLPFI